MKQRVILTTLAACLPATTSLAAVIVSEDFESYADTAAMQANWDGGGLGTLATGFGNPGQSAFHPGGAVNSWIGSGFSIAPSATQFIRLSVDIYDDGTSANKRISVGLRNGANPLFEMGMYNSPPHYSTRILSFADSNVAWVALEPALSATEGWHRWTVDIFQDQTVVNLDLFADGSINASHTSVGAASANPFTDLRFGGPSNLSSPGGGANFDNIRLEVLDIPEPAAASLLGLGLLTLLGTRRRR